ncbi:hypothetical protein [Pseudomonas fluorescens]|uniref:50S ribosomal protein L7/L12 n=1 Tax=Pseudomonas fluorescens TaxID=294 RepID=A0A5E7JWS2_PSEFL|nr:hypothetical protein PS880_02432 [Pseudomonas fluorescens]
MSLTNDQIIEAIGEKSVLESVETIKALEEKFGVHASKDQTHTPRQENLNSIFNSNESSSSSISHPIAPGTKIHVLYDGESFTGEAAEYFKTSSGSWALAVNINVNAGTQIKGFLARKNPVFTLL